MTFRQSLQNLIDSSKPDSPTDAVFLFGSLVTFAVWILCAGFNRPVPQLTEIIGFLVLCKSVKVAGTWAKGQSNAAANNPVGQ